MRHDNKLIMLWRKLLGVTGCETELGRLVLALLGEGSRAARGRPHRTYDQVLRQGFGLQGDGHLAFRIEL